jgi:hypothetical protein
MHSFYQDVYDFVKNKKNLYILVFLIMFTYVASIFLRDLTNSLFFHPKERINIVVYDKHTTMYSLGISDVGDYAVLFYPDIKIRVPESYGHYRVGALGKLVYLENNPDIFRKAFTADLSTFIDFYFYKNSDNVYYGEERRGENRIRPSFLDIMLNSSNASIFDKIYLAMFMNSKQNKDFQLISYLKYKDLQGDKIFSSKEFIRNFQGVFYQSVYREENKNIQIIYNERFSNANMISSILAGSGIRVSDISIKDKEKRGENDIKKSCILIENTADTFSQTTNRLAEFFDCKRKKGETDIYDIMFVLNDLEKRWSVK